MTGIEALKELKDFAIDTSWHYYGAEKHYAEQDIKYIEEQSSIIEKDLEVLEALKKLFIDYIPAVKVMQYTDGSHAMETQDFNSIVSIDKEDYNKITEWLKNEQEN